MNPFDSYLRTRLGRRTFLRMSGLAALTGAVASFTGIRAARPAKRNETRRNARAYGGTPRFAQYGRARGRYPTSKRS